MGFADLHIHTTYSWDGTSTVSGVLKRAADYTDLNVIAITDHDRIEGSLEAVQMAPSYGLEAIPGVEISSADGHVIGLFITKTVPLGLSFRETVLRVGEQGGLAIAAHPGARGSHCLRIDVVRQALQDPDVARILVGVEVFNSGLVERFSNALASDLADSFPVARIGCSDAHLLWMIGQAMTRFPGKTAVDLRQALINRTTEEVVNHLSSSLSILSGWVQHFLLRKAGWVTWNPNPGAPLQLGRVSKIPFSGETV